MVADQRADFDRAGADRGLAVENHLDAPVIVFKVRVGGESSQVHPFADVGMTEESVVIFVGVTVDDRLFHSATESAAGADRVALAALGTQKPGLLAHKAGAFNAGEG